MGLQNARKRIEELEKRMSEKNAPNPNADALRDLVAQAGGLSESPYTPAAARAPQQVPSVGRIVHFVYGGQHLPAIITDPAFVVPEGVGELTCQALTVFLVNAPPFTTVATYADEQAPGTWLNGTWHWPERV